MKKIPSLTLLVLLLVSSCTKESSTGPQDPATLDRTAITNLINDEYSTLLADASYYGIEDTTGSKGKIFSPINLIHWFRSPSAGVAKDFSIQLVGDTAYVTITFNLSGTLYIYYLKNLEIDSIQKNFSDDFTRNAVFVRIGQSNETYRGWRLRGISPALVKSPGSLLSVDSVSIQTTDTTYHFGYNKLRSVWSVDDSFSEIPSFRAGDSITMTYYVSGDTADCYFHFGWKDTHARFLIPADPVFGQFSRLVILPDTIPDRINFAFDAINFSALHTTEGDYFSSAFIIPAKRK
ncbi:hypothetical protein JXA84_03935 [candidate division WOR-3 bacterium]|nr:hypothetical protein [candidate division WOR-3 bacterium]